MARHGSELHFVRVMRLGYGKRIWEQARVEGGNQTGGCDRAQSRGEITWIIKAVMGWKEDAELTGNCEKESANDYQMALNLA